MRTDNTVVVSYINILREVCPGTTQRSGAPACTGGATVDLLGGPVRALDTYVHRAAPWRKADQLLLCYGPLKRGLPASKHTLSRYIVDAINMSYESSDIPSRWESRLIPLGVWWPPRTSSQVSHCWTSATLRDSLRPRPLSGSMALTYGPIQALPPSCPRYAPRGYTLGRDG